MPARPLSDETLHLIDAVRDALAQHSDVQERPLFGWYAFFVDGKLCLGVKGDELLVRLPPDTHDAVAETPGVRTLDTQGKMQGYFCVEPSAYATRAQWEAWIGAALAFNPRAKASPRRAKAASTAKARAQKPAPKRHSIFENDDL